MRRRNSSVSESLKGRRSRAGSIMQMSGLSVSITPNSLGFESEDTNVILGKRRAQSFSCAQNTVGVVKQESLLLYPLTNHEKEQLWSREVNQYESEFLVDLNDQLRVEELLNEEFLEFQEHLKYTHRENDLFLKETNQIVNDLNELLTISDQVTLQTVDFQTKSTRLIDEIEQLSTLHHDLSKYLTLFETLDPIVQTLNTSSSGSIVIKKSFHDLILKKLDNCLKFVEDPKHAKFKEIEIYKHRFKQCMIRALSLLRNYITTGLREIEEDLSTRINEEKKKDSAGMTSASTSILVDTFVYGQFEDDAITFRPLILELYTRAVANQEYTDEYMGLLNDVYNQYFKTRLNLLNYIIQTHMSTQDTSVSSVQLVQSNIIYFNKLMEKEYSMFKNIFFMASRDCTPELDNATNLMSLTKCFESLLDPLYYLLRNKIIRENSISELCELISILQSYFDTEEFESTSQFDEDENGVYQHEPTLQERIQLGELYTPILEDTQTRLVFRIQVYVDKNIVSYKKTGQELSIGNRRFRKDSKGSISKESESELQLRDSVLEESVERASSETTVVEKNHQKTFREREDSIFSLGATGVNLNTSSQSIYPPIIKAIKLLMKIYQLLNQKVFDDLANSVVHLSILSMRDNFGTMPGIEPKLYQIKNLMFLKEYISTFEIEHVRREINLDFTGIKSLFKRFMKGDNSKQVIDSNFAAAAAEDKDTSNFLSLLVGTMPKVVNDFVDCRYELQMALRNAVHEFIEESTMVFTRPLKMYPQKATLQKTMDRFIRTLKNELPRLKPRVKLFLEDEKVLSFLIDGIQESVSKEYEIFYSEALKNEKSQQVESLIETESWMSMWAEIVSEMLSGTVSEDDLLNPEEEFSVTASEVDDYEQFLTSENGDVSNLNLNSFR